MAALTFCACFGALIGADTRLRLAGWSFGALVAVSMTAEAEAADRPFDRLHLLDPPPPHPGARTYAYDDDDLRTVFERELPGSGAQLPLADAGQSYAEHLAHCCRANLAAMAAHTPHRLTRTPSTLWLATRAVTELPLAPDPGTLAFWDNRCVQHHVLDVLGAVPGAARVRAWRRRADGNLTAGSRHDIRSP